MKHPGSIPFRGKGKRIIKTPDFFVCEANLVWQSSSLYLNGRKFLHVRHEIHHIEVLEKRLGIHLSHFNFIDGFKV